MLKVKTTEIMSLIKKITIVIVFFGFLINQVNSQDTKISLDECYKRMLSTHPLANQTDINTKASELAVKNINTGWLPNTEFNAQATYQSEAIKVDISAFGNNFGFEGERDQYRASVDINQMIFDWGRIKAAKDQESVNMKINQQTTKIELNKIKEQVNKFFFAVLILQCNINQLNVMVENIEAKQQTVESGVKNGVLLNSNINVLQAEKIKLKQSIYGIQLQQRAAIDVLSEITGSVISYDTKFQLPNVNIGYSDSLKRAELVMFEFQREKLDATSKIISKQNKPTLFGFGQLGYGKPGFNMVNTSFDPFYIVGLGVSWKFWDWNKTSRKRKIISLSKDYISTQRESFNKQVAIALKNEEAKIKNLEEALKSDLEIIALREEVTKSAQSQLDNGVITSSQYLTELSSETEAKINYQTHKIELVQSKVNYLYIRGEM